MGPTEQGAAAVVVVAVTEKAGLGSFDGDDDLLISSDGSAASRTQPSAMGDCTGGSDLGWRPTIGGGSWTRDVGWKSAVGDGSWARVDDTFEINLSSDIGAVDGTFSQTGWCWACSVRAPVPPDKVEEVA